MKLMDTYKGIASVQIGNGKTVQFWNDSMDGMPFRIKYPELFSFAERESILLVQAKAEENFSDLFNQPLSEEAYDQWQLLYNYLENLQLAQGNDIWKHMGQKHMYEASRVYKALIGHLQVHPSFKWLWKAKGQPKDKVFFWLLLHNCLNTRELLKRRNMQLESYTCEMCILQKEESLKHLLVTCNFAKNFWASLGINIP